MAPKGISVGYGVCDVATCTSYTHNIMLFISLVKLWILFLSMVETLVIVSGGLLGLIFTKYSGLIQIVTNLIYCMGLKVFG